MRQIAEKIKVWLNATEGVTAVEFSLVAWPFIMIVCAIIELSLIFVAQSLINGSVSDASRLIRTGQIQQASASSQLGMFTSALCGTASVMLTCSKFQYQVQTITDFSSANLAMPATDKNGNLLSEPFDPGTANSVVLIRVVYLYPLLTPFIGVFLSDYPGNTKLLEATTVLEVEPYDGTS